MEARLVRLCFNHVVCRYQEIRVDARKFERIVGWLLFVSYAIGSPIGAIIEARTGAVSDRFDYSPEFLYLVSGLQFLCALVLFNRFLAPWSIGILTVISMGAVYSHFRIASPITSIPAILYTLIQVWYGVRVYRDRARLTH